MADQGTNDGLHKGPVDFDVSSWNPGLLSGLALSGANRPFSWAAQTSPDEAAVDARLAEDGILTALEVANMDFSDTELVVLSACDTGLGKVAGGEGVLGLQRAFQIAGARSVVASLWKVDDNETKDLMKLFYTNLWVHKMPKLKALRQAQLDILRSRSPATAGSQRGPGEKKHLPDAVRTAPAHPRRWAAWVLSGDFGTVTGVSPR